MDNLNKALEKAVDSLEDVIKGITRKENISPADLEHLSKSICTVERIRNIQREEQGNGFDDYSGNSYRRGRSHTRYMSRDNERFDNAFNGGNSNRHYDSGSNHSSRIYHDNASSTRRYYDSNGYSGHSIKDRMIDKLEKMFDETQSEHEKQVVQDWIDRLTYDF